MAGHFFYRRILPTIFILAIFLLSGSAKAQQTRDLRLQPNRGELSLIKLFILSKTIRQIFKINKYFMCVCMCEGTMVYNLLQYTNNFKY